ncbi:MAG: lysophospholipid acyltransferase family protein [Pirellulales bacterium]
MAVLMLFRYRATGQNRVPASGAVLVVSNHQSNLDPVLVGIACHRRLNYLARKTLFRFAPFGWLIQSLDAIPLDRDGLGLEGLKETMRRLKREQAVLLFPEGTRTHDGQIAPLRPGFCGLARRGKVSLLPVAIDGGYEAWPRDRLLPRRARVAVCFGRPLSSDVVAQYEDDQLVELVRQRMLECQAIARRMNGR